MIGFERHVSRKRSCERPERLAGLRRSHLLRGGRDPAIVSFVDGLQRRLPRGRASLTVVDASDCHVLYGHFRAISPVPNALSICAALIGMPEDALVVPDAAADARFQDCAQVGYPLGHRFFVGICLVFEGERVGVLCITDAEPGSFSDEDMAALRREAAVAERLIVANSLRVADVQDLAGELCDLPVSHHVPLRLQPIASADSLVPVAYEALLRWRRRDGRPVSPATLIPLADRLGLMRSLDRAVLETAVRRATTLSPTVSVSVNVSASWFAHGRYGLPAMVERILASSGFPADRLIVEVTERLMFDASAGLVAELEAIRSLGARIALDDFGTGLSSLSRLARLPVDLLKLDRDFTEGLPGDPRVGRVLAGIMGLARSLELPVCIEGIETEDQLAAARDAGCDLVQGFLVDRSDAADA